MGETKTSEGAVRRKALLEYLSKQTIPVNGTDLAGIFHVSRQVIVQDIALLRAENRNILSTNKGYMIFQSGGHTNGSSAVIMVNHTAEQTLDEMRAIVELGGRMLDVSVDHDLYGHIRLDLVINNIRDAEEFCSKMAESKSLPLKTLTDGYHFHTIQAPSEKALELIRQELLRLKILIP